MSKSFESSRAPDPKTCQLRFLVGLWLLGFDVSLGFGFWTVGIHRMIRVVLPHHLRTLARVGDEVHVDLNGSATVREVIEAIESKYPMLRGTIRDHETQK